MHGLDIPKRADFAMALQLRSQMTWREITMAGRHGLGTEFMPASSIKPSTPEAFEDTERFLVMRYSGRLPMAGVRVNDVFHILWIEPEYNKLYDH